MKKLLIAMAIAGLLVALIAGYSKPISHNDNPQDHRTENQNSSTPVEFQYTKDELKSLEKWKNKSLDDTMSDALNGDPAAMHMIGMCLLFGHGIPINVSQANSFFSMAASLGYAPSIDKIRAMYTEDDPNPFLSLIYVNLVTSFGHSEYSLPYHNQRTKIIEKFGRPIVDEIERIAMLKMKKIIQNQKALKETEDKLEVTTELLMLKSIVKEDIAFGLDHWQNLAKIPSEGNDSYDN